MLLPFERELVLRGDFEAVLPRDDFAAPPVVLFADERVPLDLRAADEAERLADAGLDDRA